MKAKWLPAAALAVLVSGSLGAAGDIGGPVAQKKAGEVLLDEYMQPLREMAQHGSTKTVEFLEQWLQKMAVEARKAKEAGEIDAYFFAWYGRILAVTRLFIAPDPGRVLAPVIDREVADFLMDTLGEAPVAPTGGEALGQIAKALATEVVNLQVYLDTKATREALMKKLGLVPEARQK